MILQRAKSYLIPYETKYPCILCLQRVKIPVKCLRCSSMICNSHVKKLHDICPYCRLTPFLYQRDAFMEELINLDRKKEQEFLIQTSVFKCLVQGCDFQGKYHKMDLHRRKFHRNQTLRQIIFLEDRQNGKKIRAVQQLLKRIQQKHQQQNKFYQIALILHGRSKNRMQIAKLIEMIQHVDKCHHKDCEKILVQDTMCFIGTKDKQISQCLGSQQFLKFF